MHALSETITRLRKIIKTHQSALMKHETVTRYALVDPMLQALGWDVADPAVVIPEYQVSGYGKTKAYADYALFDTRPRKNSPEDPSVIVEAKKLGSPDKEMGAAEKSAQHTAGVANAKYYAITDGNNWLLYQFASSTTQQIMNFRLDEPNAKIFALCEKILPLGQMYLGRDVFSDDPNLVVRPKQYVSKPIENVFPNKPKLALSPMSPSAPPNWVMLTKAHQTLWNPTARSQLNFTVQLPSGVKETAIGWANLSRIVINWLDQRRFLDNLTKVPVKNGSRQLFANIRPRGATGKSFARPYLASVSGLHFELHGSSTALMQSTIALLKMVGQDPDDILVKLKHK